jgi:hypothetical protein
MEEECFPVDVSHAPCQGKAGFQQRFCPVPPALSHRQHPGDPERAGKLHIIVIRDRALDGQRYRCLGRLLIPQG